MATRTEVAEKNRCVGEKLYGNFMTFGPRIWQRCKNQATTLVVAQKEKSKTTKGKLCDSCYEDFKTQDGRKHTATPIKKHVH